MATNKPTESIDDKAFQALEEALKIDFDDLAPDTPVKDTPAKNSAATASPSPPRSYSTATSATTAPG